MARRRPLFLLVNPGGTRRIRLGRRKVFTVEIDRATKKILRAQGHTKIPTFWIGVPFRKVPELERAMRRIARDRTVCDYVEKCREPTPDRLGRRRPCRQTFRRKRDVFEALDDALDGRLLRLLDQADDGAPELLDLERHTGSGRRRRRLRSWGAALDWTAPSSRRWADFDPARLALVSEMLGQVLDRAGVPHSGLRLPRQTERILDAATRQIACDADAGDRTAQALAEALAELAEVPF